MISIDESKCTQCGLCVPVCVRRILEEDGERIRVTDPALCNYCGHCKAVCPGNAPFFSNLEEGEFEDLPKVEKLPQASDFLRFLRRRRSLRLYRDKPVEVEKLKTILEAGRFAPTGGNRQACEYVVVRGRKVLDRVATLTLQALDEEGRRIREAIERQRRMNEPVARRIPCQTIIPCGLGSNGPEVERGRGPAFLPCSCTHRGPSEEGCGVDPGNRFGPGKHADGLDGRNLGPGDLFHWLPDLQLGEFERIERNPENPR